MKKSSWSALVLVVAVSGVGLWLFFNGADVPSNSPITLQSSPDITPSVTAQKAQPAVRKALFKLEQEDVFDPYENEVLMAQLQQVSEVYAENIKYPITSQPIYNPEDAREYEEYEQAEVDLPFPENAGDDNPIRISAATNTFQYFAGDAINVRVQISGAPEDTFIQVTGVISGTNGDLPIQGVFEPSDAGLSQFTALFDTKLAPTQLLTPEMLVKINIIVGDRPLFTTVAFRYAQASAQIVGVRPVRTQGPNLVIPLQVNVYQNGYYFVNGVLEDAKTGQPLIQLQAEKRLLQGNGVIDLTAHIAALRTQGSEGPYVLRSLRTYRGAEVGERYDAPASTTQARYNVRGFPFTEYEDQEYEDKLGQERLDFLRDLGTLDEDDSKL